MLRACPARESELKHSGVYSKEGEDPLPRIKELMRVLGDKDLTFSMN